MVDGGEKRFGGRNRLRLVTPWKWTGLCMSLYIDEEFFFLRDQGIDQNRLSIGVMTPYSKYFQIRVFYMLRNLKIAGEWSHQNVLGLEFSFSF